MPCAGGVEPLDCGFVRSAAGRPAPAEAVVRSYELLELAQNTDASALIAPLMAQARSEGWAEVEALLWYAVQARTSVSGEDDAPDLHRLQEAAQASGDEALLALALAAMAERPQGPGRATDPARAHAAPALEDSDEADGLLARAVAMLDEGGGSVVHRPTAYVACGLGYKARGLWELEEEMYVRAAEGLALPLPPPLDRTQVLTGRAMWLNRFEAVLSGACALLELGDREAARALVRGRLHPPDLHLMELPDLWASETEGVRGLLSAIAGEPEPQTAEAALQRLQGSPWAEYRGFVALGRAVRALDRGAGAEAAALAGLALPDLDVDLTPTAHTLALALAARAEQAPAAQRYARTLARLRWQARIRLLGSARARLVAERVMLENERLSQRAYVDELTGLANRHAYTRQLARLRRSPPELTVAVMMVDIDHFKTVNDVHGHGVGDEVLRRVGALLADGARPADLVVRLGGDEFVMILDLARPLDAAARGIVLIEDVARQPWGELAAGLRVGLSIGLATGSAVFVDDLLRAADRFLYEAKASGRGRLVDGST